VATTGKAEIFADRLADNRAAGVENARNDCRIDIRHVAFHCRGAIHHRHAGNAGIVLERDRLAFELAGGGTCDFRLDVPGTVPIFL
jgi:hypothetical protein